MKLRISDNSRDHSLLIRLSLEGLRLRRFQRDAPMEIDSAKCCVLVEERKPIAGRRCLAPRSGR